MALSKLVVRGVRSVRRIEYYFIPKRQRSQEDEEELSSLSSHSSQLQSSSALIMETSADSCDCLSENEVETVSR